MGSIAASQYRGSVDALTRSLPVSVEGVARSSLAGALRVAQSVPPGLGRALASGAESAFIDGIHVAVTAGATFAVIAAVITWRFLPNTFEHQASLHDPVAALEGVAELGLGGVPPVFAETD